MSGDTKWGSNHSRLRRLSCLGGFDLQLHIHQSTIRRSQYYAHSTFTILHYTTLHYAIPVSIITLQFCRHSIVQHHLIQPYLMKHNSIQCSKRFNRNTVPSNTLCTSRDNLPFCPWRPSVSSISFIPSAGLTLPFPYFLSNSVFEIFFFFWITFGPFPLVLCVWGDFHKSTCHDHHSRGSEKKVYVKCQAFIDQHSMKFSSSTEAHWKVLLYTSAQRSHVKRPTPGRAT